MNRPHLQFLGTGTAFHEDGRGSQCLLVRPPSGPCYLVDLGPTALAAAARFGVATDRLDRLFVTHLHGDHVAGWPFLLLHLRFIDRRSRPFEVYGPEGVRECLERLLRSCYAELAQPSALGFEVRYHELPVADRQGARAGDSCFDTVPMDHHPSSIGYRFVVGERRVAVTGDTRWCDGLERLARSSDVLVVECSSVRAQRQAAHVSLEEIREGVSRLGEGEIVLVHLPDEVAADLAVDPVPRVSASHDGMLYPL